MENMCYIFEKAKGRGRTGNRTCVYSEAAVFKKGVEKFHKINKKTSVWESLFDKVKLCRSATLSKVRL